MIQLDGFRDENHQVWRREDHRAKAGKGMTLMNVSIGILLEGCWLTLTSKQRRELRSIHANLAVLSRHAVDGGEMDALADWCKGLIR